MKQKITFKLCLAMLGLLLSFSAGAANKEGEVTIEQLKYTLYDDGTASVVAANISTISGEIVIPESVENNNNTYRVTKIGSGAFEGGCTGLTAITIPNSVNNIGSYAFTSCTRLTSITIPNSVTTIRESTFDYCIGLTSITIPNSVTKIYYRAFASCRGLTSITIPNSVTTIKREAFAFCYGLTAITIPNSVTTIDELAFRDCTELTSITIPNSVTTIGQSAFANCTKLQEIKVYVEEPITITDYVFYAIDYSTCKLYVPQGSIEKYQAAAVWSKFTNISALPIPTAIGEVDEDELNVYSIDGKVVIKNLREGEAISICNTTGQNVYQGNETEVPLNKGIYFVKVGTIVSKVMVQ